MQFDVFLSICQTEVEGYTPSEKTMFAQFWSQALLADELGYETAWVAETHLSCQTQKQNPQPVIPFFKGEIGLNTDILQMAHLIFAHTKKIKVGSAIRNIIAGGGPIGQAEAVRTYCSLREMLGGDSRVLELGFAAGRFPFTQRAFGFYPRTAWEKAGWGVVKNQYFRQGVEIFLRLLKGEELSPEDLDVAVVGPGHFRTSAEWQAFSDLATQAGLARSASGEVRLPVHWDFEKLSVIPREAPLEHLRLTIGSHDPEIQEFANRFFPVGVFNLSITPEKIIQETHVRMQKAYRGQWTRAHMPRTAMVFIDENRAKAKHLAESAWRNYWVAMEGTLDPKKVEEAVANTLAGDPLEVAEMIKAKYHPEDRLMLWFDFNVHDNEWIKKSMRTFIDKIAPRLG